jgi:hypothetical protein
MKSNWRSKSQCKVRFLYSAVLTVCLYRKHRGMEKWAIGEFHSIDNLILLSHYRPILVHECVA